MDEILIEEKKYVSSKRAAKMTGYAKDYIGQLCREGRVPARLIGRSWYVLEAAIQDHRFGAAPIESSRYETVETPTQPVEAERVGEEVGEEIEQREEETFVHMVTPQNIQDSWKEWFESFEQPVESEAAPTLEVGAPTESVGGEQQEIEAEREESVSVPIHTISRPRYQPPPEEFLPHREVVIEPRRGSDVLVRRKTSNNVWAMRTVQIVGVLFALISVATAFIGSGYLDNYIVSFNQVHMIAGVEFYNK